jgi:hypothetical protein
MRAHFAAMLLAAPLAAQTPPPAAPPLEVGAPAPDFALPAATRFGTLDQPIRLSDFKGKAVVLAFYFRSRTRG